jgi:hypothetical protein
MKDLELDNYDQMNLTEQWHFDLLNILEDICSPSVNPEKTLTAYMPEIIKLVRSAK